MSKRSERNSEGAKSSLNSRLNLDQRHVIELLNVLAPPVKEGQRWNDLLSRLEADAPQQVLARYARHGGNTWALLGCLHLLLSKPSADGRSFRRFEKCALSCLKGIEALFNIQEQVPETVVCIARKLRAELVQAYQARLTYEKGKGLLADFVKSSRSKQGGRPAGSQTSLLLCLIGKEFCQLFQSPRYEDILVLAKAANPDEFPNTTTSEHIRQRIRDFQQANKSYVEDSHKMLFPVTNL